MGIFSRFERRVEDGFEGMNDKLFDAPISPVQIAKKCEKQMRREKMVGAGKEFAPTLYTILVNPRDDERLFGYYPTLAGETETYLRAKAAEDGAVMDGNPLVRFIVDDDLKSGKFDVIAEMVSAPIIEQLRAEEMQRYGLIPARPAYEQPAPAEFQPTPYEQDLYAPENQHDYESSGVDVMVDDPESIESEEYVDLNAVPAIAGAGMGAAAAAEAIPHPDTVMFDDNRPAKSTGEAKLVNLNTGRVFPLIQTRIQIGRATTCDIIMEDLNVSRTHAEVTCDGPNIWGITDLGSKNGTLVNGKHIVSTTLREGDRVTLGTTTFLFTYN